MKCPECGADGFMPEAGCFSCGYLLAPGDGETLPEAQKTVEASGADEITAPPAGNATDTPAQTEPNDQAQADPDTQKQDGPNTGAMDEPDMPLSELNDMLTALGVAPLSDPEANRSGDQGQPEVETPPEDESSMDAKPLAGDGAPEDAHASAGDAAAPDLDDIPVWERRSDAKAALADARFVAGPKLRVTRLLKDSFAWVAGVFSLLGGVGHRLAERVAAGLSSAGNTVARWAGALIRKKPDGGLKKSGTPEQTGQAEAFLDADATRDAETMPALDAPPGLDAALDVDMALEAETVQKSEAALDAATASAPHDAPEPEAAAPRAKPRRHFLPPKVGRALFWVGLPVAAAMLTIGLLLWVLSLREARVAEPELSPDTAPVSGYVPWTPPADPSLPPFHVIGE
jgi:hypothetical protein